MAEKEVKGIKKFFEEFKAFAMRGNVLDMAVGVVIGGVTIGEGCVIGAGSVVTKDIPPHSLAVGNPCKVIRQITEADSIRNREDLW
jgi:serine acetyltransferase